MANGYPGNIAFVSVPFFRFPSLLPTLLLFLGKKSLAEHVLTFPSSLVESVSILASGPCYCCLLAVGAFLEQALPSYCPVLLGYLRLASLAPVFLLADKGVQGPTHLCCATPFFSLR